MKKIPTLFKRVFENHKIVGILDEITPGCEYAFLYGTPTVKMDGACCAVINNKFYKRFDAKPGRKVPEGSIPCCDPDPVTGHWPHWVEIDRDNPDDKWFAEAWDNTWITYGSRYRTFEAIGPHFNGNPHGFDRDSLEVHGVREIGYLERTFDGVKEYLTKNEIEGIVFWFLGEPVCKIKRSDFGLPWPVKGE